jgi:hypothetical protein
MFLPYCALTDFHDILSLKHDCHQTNNFSQCQGRGWRGGEGAAVPGDIVRRAANRQQEEYFK